MASRSPASIHIMFLLGNAEAALGGPESVGVGVDFWGEPNLSLRHQRLPMVMGAVQVRAVYANLADTEQNSAILRQAVFDARAAHLSVRAAFADNETPPMLRPVVSVRYVWMDVNWLEAALCSLEDHCVPLAAPPDISPDETYTLGIWRPDRTSVQARWGVSTPGALDALSAGWVSVWEEMTDLLQRGEPVVPEELWPLDTAPEYERAPVGVEGPDDQGACAGCDEVGLAGA